MNYAKIILLNVLGSIQNDKNNLIVGNAKIKDEFFKATDEEIKQIFEGLEKKESDLINAIKFLETSLDTVS